MNEPEVTLVGNLTSDPEIRYTSQGDAVSTFTVAQTPREKRGGEWTDGQPVFMRCQAWKEIAENVSETFVKGMRVIVTGHMVARQWETKEGDKRTNLELRVNAVGPDLRYATAKVMKRNQPQYSSGERGQDDQFGVRPSQQDDPWGTPAQSAEAPF